MLDLLPHEWQVLTMIDGERDLRTIAAALARTEFEIAKIAYGLATTGIISLRVPARATPEPSARESDEHAAIITHSLMTDLNAARSSVEHLLRVSPDGPAAPEARDTLEALSRLQRAIENRAHVGPAARAAHV
jgi:hypothetical protein